MTFSKRTSDMYLVMDSFSGSLNCDIAGPIRHLYLLELKEAILYVSSDGQQTYSKIEVFSNQA